MSYYTRFADVESLLTSSTTTVLGSTDSLLVFSANDGKYHVTTVGAVGTAAGGYGGLATQATCLTTATNLANTGLSLIKSTTGTTCNWLLTDPTAANQVKIILCNTTTTSTNFTVSTVAASIQCTGSTSANLIDFGSTSIGALVNFGQSVTLLSLTSTTWLVVGIQRNPTAVSSGQVGANGTGPIFTSV